MFDDLSSAGDDEVVCAVDHQGTLADQSVARLKELVRVWAERFEELGSRPEIDYVLISEHIFAYPFIPAGILKELDQSSAYLEKTCGCLLCELANDVQLGRRLVGANDAFVAYVPFFARGPYELHIVSRRHAQAITDFSDYEQAQLAAILKPVLGAFDRVRLFAVPYSMSMHQRPTDGRAHEQYHFHIEFQPTRGEELRVGEQKARELRLLYRCALEEVR